MLKVFILIITLSLPNIAMADAIVGQTAPDFKTVDTNGNAISSDIFEGKITVLEWTNHKCPFVRKHYKSNNMQALQKKYTAEGVQWISIISSAEGKQGNVSAEEANELTNERGANPSAVVIDESGEIGKLYGAKTTPHMFIINNKGVLVYKGAIDDKPSVNPKHIENAKNYVSQALDEVMAGKAVSEDKTQQYGCSVKY